MSWQSDKIRDHVFPLSIVERQDGGFRMTRFLGTAFVIGARGYALTAAHVIRGIEGTLAGMFVPPDNGWTAFPIEGQELHPSEDVAIIKLQGNDWKSIFSVTSTRVHSSFSYQSFGYPEDALHENLNDRLPDGRVLPRPDLVYTRGYVRRRISWNPGIPAVVGDEFLELSAVAGRGCSGSPIIEIGHRNLWPVVAIYSGERLNDAGTSVAYAVRSEAFAEWSPRIVGHSLITEARTAQQSVQPDRREDAAPG